MRTLRKQKGQVLLVVVLVVIIASTIGLSLASRSITNLRTSTEEAESQKALAAAEAGVERSLQSNTSITSEVTIMDSELKKNSTYSTKVQETVGTSFLIYGGLEVEKNEGADVWFVAHDVNGNPDINAPSSPGNLNLYWGTEDCSAADKPAAIQAIVVTNNGGAISSYRYAYDPCSGRGNNFTAADNNTENVLIDGVNLKYNTPMNDLTGNIVSPKNIVLMRVIPIYKNTKIGISVCNHDGHGCGTALLTQGHRIDSTGKSGEANRRLWVYNGYPQTYLPYLSYGLFVAN
jgi:hypothetical protein